MSAPVLTARGLHKAFGPQVLLEDASASIHEGERVGLVGINGSGKSTLARILAGIEPTDRGEVAVRKDATVHYLAQEPVLDPEATAHDVAAEGLATWQAARKRHDELSHALADAAQEKLDGLLRQQGEATAEVERLGGWDALHRVDAILTRLGVDRPHARVGTMSGGERRRVALARILVARPTLAILDEPTNHLDVETIEWLERYLIEEHEGALLLITHDRYVLDRVVGRTLELDRGTLHSFDGGWEDYLTTKAERMALEARTESNRQNFLRRELEWLSRQPKARTGKQKARIQRAEGAQAAKPDARRERVTRLDAQTTRTGKTILELRDVSLEVAGRRLVEGLDLTLTKGERIGIVGRNGTGKTTLLRALVGEMPVAGGNIVTGKNTRFAYFDQARSELDDDEDILTNVAGDRRTVELGDREVDVRGWLHGFLFDGAKQRQKVGALSGGERARVALAKLMLQPANVFLFDEPTNDLDVQTLSALEEMLLDMNGTALVVTHDRYFLDRMATAILAFEGDGRVVRYAGNYDTYRTLRAEAEKRSNEEAKATAKAKRSAAKSDDGAKPKAKAKAKRALTYGERIELDGLMERIEEAETVVGEREAALADPSVYADRGDEVPALTTALEEARAELEKLVARWEELETKQEAGDA